MPVYLKQATTAQRSAENEIHQIVADILTDVEANREMAVRRYAEKFDRWTADIIVTEEQIEERTADVCPQIKEDIRFAYDQVYGFSLKQLSSMHPFETEIYPGMTLGQRLIPCHCTGCYVPGGRFAHIASAIMSIATARAAGVPSVIACSPPFDDAGIHPSALYAMSICKPDVLMTLGGVQAIAAMAYGVFTGTPADMVVGPGNRYVAEAKRLLYGRVGIDVLAGPSENLLIAERTADPFVVAVDLISQAEHGFDSPVWLVTDSRSLAKAVMAKIPHLIADLPDPEAAAAAWADYGEVILCSDREEMATVSDQYAPEHVQVQAEGLDWWLGRLKNYGSLFLGEQCTVAFGDKTSGTNHILPTNKAARYSGGLSVGKFIKTVTYQRATRDASRRMAAVASRISRAEGMEGHARAADVRLRKYFPNEEFDFQVYDFSAGLADSTAKAESGQRPPLPAGHGSKATKDPCKATAFTKQFTKQEAIPEEGIARAVGLLRSGRLHRYNTAGGEESDVALLEKEFADYLGLDYCAAVSSCGSAMYLALKCAGVKAGDKVLSNAFTLAPAPGAIYHAGAQPVLVESTEHYTINTEDLSRKVQDSGAEYLLLSHMRGHMADMDLICQVCDRHGISFIEDCAHTMGARWGSGHSGTFGKIGCFSSQTYKHINSGEGGLLVTNDDEVIAQAILYSGSYMLFDGHISRPPLEVFERFKYTIPNLSLRMSNLEAALLRPQLRMLDERAARWNQRYHVIEDELSNLEHIWIPKRHPKEHFVGSSFQFTLKDLDRSQIERFLEQCDRRGVQIAWFGWKDPRGYTSTFESWQYIADVPDLPDTVRVLDCLCDFRVPLTFSTGDCKTIAAVIRNSLQIVVNA